MAFVLVDDIARLMGRESDDLQPQIAALIDRVRAGVEAHDGVWVEGLGLFRSIEGHLAFEPEDGLETIINPIYGGLRPIEIGSEGQLQIVDFQPDPVAGDAPDLDTESKEEAVEVLDPDDLTTDQVWTPRLEGKPDDLGEPPVESTMEDAEFAVLPPIQKGSVEDRSTEEVKATFETLVQSPAPRPAVATVPTPSSESSTRPVWLWGLPVLALLVAGLWLVIWLTGDDPEPLPTVEPVVTSSSPVATPTPVQAAVDTEVSIVNEPVAEPVDPVPEPAGFAAPEGRWTWRIASHTDPTVAEADLQRYERPDLQGEVVRAVVDGQVWYRVTLGRYATVEQARAARDLLPPHVPDDVFVGTIQ